MCNNGMVHFHSTAAVVGWMEAYLSRNLSPCGCSCAWRSSSQHCALRRPAWGELFVGAAIATSCQSQNGYIHVYSSLGRLPALFLAPLYHYGEEVVASYSIHPCKVEEECRRMDTADR